MTDQLDDLLSQPLADVADDGFSGRVVARIADERRRDQWITYGAIGLAAAPVLFLPVPRIVAELSQLLPQLASSAPLAGAAAVLVLTLSFERLVRDRGI